MNITEAMAHVEAGGRITCGLLQRGAVVKLETVGAWPDTPTPRPRVVWETTGDGYNFDPADERFDGVEWRKVEGWAVYA